MKGFLCPIAFMPIISYLMVSVDVPLSPFVCYLGWLAVVELVFLAVFWYQKYDYPFHWQVILHSNFLGFFGAIALRLLWEAMGTSETWRGHYPVMSISIFILVLCFFHFSEFLTTALYNSNTLTIDSFLLNHSVNYHMALMLAIVEFLAECYLLPSKYQLWWLIPLGTVVCLLGELIRKTGMITAGENFSHIIVQDFKEEHLLVTDGIYGLCRHPSYLGWFLWSVGTQVSDTKSNLSNLLD